MVLVCHKISQGHVTKGRINITDRSTSWQVTSVPRLVAIGTVTVKINDFRLLHDLVRPRDQRVM